MDIRLGSEQFGILLIARLRGYAGHLLKLEGRPTVKICCSVGEGGGNKHRRLMSTALITQLSKIQ